MYFLHKFSDHAFYEIFEMIPVLGPGKLYQEVFLSFRNAIAQERWLASRFEAIKDGWIRFPLGKAVNRGNCI